MWKRKRWKSWLQTPGGWRWICNLPMGSERLFTCNYKCFKAKINKGGWCPHATTPSYAWSLNFQCRIQGFYFQDFMLWSLMLRWLQVQLTWEPSAPQNETYLLLTMTFELISLQTLGGGFMQKVFNSKLKYLKSTPRHFASCTPGRTCLSESHLHWP